MRAEPKKTTVSRTFSRRKCAIGSRNSESMRNPRASGLARNLSFKYATGRRSLWGGSGVGFGIRLELFDLSLQFAYRTEQFRQFLEGCDGAQPLARGERRRSRNARALGHVAADPALRVDHRVVVDRQ